MPNKLSQFWQKLKRRNVTRVLAVYIAAAFMLLELISMFSEQIGLPDGTWKVAFIISFAGLVITAIFSWINDIHPEGGIVKTEPVKEDKFKVTTSASTRWKIASYISFVVIVGLIVLNVFPRKPKKEILDKSIAVLPFRNDSPSDENENIINGYMASIHDKLCHIKDLKVLSLLSTEQYRNNPKSIEEIAREQNVSYFLSASGQMYNSRMRLIVQFMDADENILWSNPYDRKISLVDDHISMQSEIAQMIANEINVLITPDELKLIDKIPTSNLSAYTYWTLGNEEELKSTSIYLASVYDESIDRAEKLYLKALEYDPAFSQAYAGLASIYWKKYHDKEYFTDNFLDSARSLIDLALKYDNDIALAHKLYGDYYYRLGHKEKAIYEYNRALELNPNDWQIYMGLGRIYLNDDLLQELVNYHKAATINRGNGLSEIYRSIASTLSRAGFSEKSWYYLDLALTFDGDSTEYILSKAGIVSNARDYEETIELDWKVFEMDTTQSNLLINIGGYYTYIGNNKEALVAFERYLNTIGDYRDIEGNNTHRIAYAYWVNGNHERANYFFEKQMEYCRGDIELGRAWGTLYYPYYDMAGIYAFKGETDKALENLRIFNKKERQALWMVNLIKIDPLFDNIRDEPEFQQIVRDVEAKFQAEHERVRQWLEENDCCE